MRHILSGLSPINAGAVDPNAHNISLSSQPLDGIRMDTRKV